MLKFVAWENIADIEGRMKERSRQGRIEELNYLVCLIGYGSLRAALSYEGVYICNSIRSVPRGAFAIYIVGVRANVLVR